MEVHMREINRVKKTKVPILGGLIDGSTKLEANWNQTLIAYSLRASHFWINIITGESLARVPCNRNQLLGSNQRTMHGLVLDPTSILHLILRLSTSLIGSKDQQSDPQCFPKKKKKHRNLKCFQTSRCDPQTMTL